MAVSRDKHKTPAFLEKASREQKKIQDKLHLKLQDDILRLFQEGTYSDITLPCGPTPMLIHRAIIESRVPGLLDIICPDGVPNKIILDAIAAEDLRQFIQCVYNEDDLAKAWQTFLSDLAVHDKQEEHRESTGTGPERDTGQHSKDDKELEEASHGAQGGRAASDTSRLMESSEVEGSCQSYPSVENVDTSGGTCIHGELDGVSENQTVAEELEGTHGESSTMDKVLQGQKECLGNDIGTSASLPEGEETNSTHAPLTNGINQAEVPLDDYQGTATASVVSARSQMDSVQLLDVCQYVSMDSPMGFVPKPLEQNEKPATDLSQAKGASCGLATEENIVRMNITEGSGVDKLDDANEETVNGIVSLAVNGPTKEGTHGAEYKQLTQKSLLHDDHTSSTLKENSGNQADSEKEKSDDPVPNAHVSHSDEVHQFVARVNDLPVPSGTLAENLMHLLDSDSSISSDFALVCSDGTRIPAHRFILHCRCDFFAAMLGGGWIESESNEMQLTGVSKLVVDAILKFIYGGTASLSDDINLRDLLGAADMYGLQGLKEVTAFHLKRDWCHLFHKPLCAECLGLVPHCYALCESFGLPDLSQTCLRWMSKNMDRFWVQKTFSSLPPEMLENCSKDVEETLTVKNVIEVLFQLDKIKLSLPQGQSSWAEPVKEVTSKTRKKVLQFAAKNFHRILVGQTFEDKYLKGMGWKKDVMESLFRKVVAGLSLENADRNFRDVWRLYKRELTEKEKKEGKKTPEEEWSPDAYAAVGAFYDKIYNYVVSNASYIVHTEAFKGLPEDLQKQIRKDAVYVDEGLSKMTKKPVLSSSQRPKSAQVRRTLSHPLRASSPASSTSSASSTASAPSSSRSQGRGGRARTGSARGAGASRASSRGTGGPPRSANGITRGVGRGSARGAGGSSRDTEGPPRGAGSRCARETGRGGAVGRGGGAGARGDGTGRSRGGGSGVAGRDYTQRSARPRDGRQPTVS